MVGAPVRLSETPGSVRTPSPMLGEHTSEVLRDLLGMSAAEVAALRGGRHRRPLTRALRPVARAGRDGCYPMAMSDRSLDLGATHAAAAVSSRAATQAIGTTFSVILSLSFCHLLNDMMQSLVPALYPILKTLVRAELRPDRPDHPGLPVHGLHAATPGRPLYRPPPATVFPDRRHRPHPGRPPVDVPRLDVSRHPARRHVDRDGLVDLPSRSLARGPHGGRWTLRARAVPLPGRREHWLGLGPIARGLRRRTARPVEHRVVLGGRADRDGRAAAGWRLVRAPPPARRRARAPRPPRWCPPRRPASTCSPAGR